MKRKFISILLALVLVLSFSLVTAVPVAAATTADYNAAVTKAADRLAATQNPDGGFDWELDLGSNLSYSNLGISAIGILKGYEIEAKLAYKEALAETYNYTVVNKPVWIFNDTWGETGGVNSFPDITFMIWLAEAAADDESLLAEINELQDPDIAATDIADLAKERWDDRVLHLGSTADPAAGTATVMAEFLRDLLKPYHPWDLEAAVKAALALDARFPDGGYGTQATEIANVIFTSVDNDSEPSFFFSTNNTQYEYVIALSGVIEAFEEVGLYETSALKGRLIDEQQDDGYWNASEGEGADEQSVQATAYAVMALLRQGDADAVVAAQKGADWLVSTQLTDGGWVAFYDGGEYPEMNSEAAWAIKMVLDISTSVNMIASYVPQVGISVTPSSVSFGSVVPGEPSTLTPTVTVTNTGNVAVGISTTIANESHENVYANGLDITWTPPTTPSNIPIAGIAEASLTLTVLAGTPADTYTATLIFWAEMAE